jgi:hypothetical protein
MRLALGAREFDNGMNVFITRIIDDPNDHTPGKNRKHVELTTDDKPISGHCECGNPSEGQYYWAAYVVDKRNPDRLISRSHGWGCKDCRGITQWG